MPDRLRPCLALAAVLALTAGLVACGDDDGGSGARDPIQTEAQTSGGDDSDGSGGGSDGDGGGGGASAPTGPGGTGAGVVTVGDQTFEFVVDFCAFSPEEAENEHVLFGLNARGETADGERLYVDVTRQVGMTLSAQRDPDLPSLDSISVHAGDFSDPTVSLNAHGEGFVQVDGRTVRADADFFDDVGGDEIPGTFEATCP